MKDKFTKMIKIFSFSILITTVFVMSFIFVNKEISLSGKVKGNMLGAQSIMSDNAESVVSPYYYGVGDKGLDTTQISMFTKDYRGSTSPFTVEVSPINQVWYFAYPDSYPPLLSIKDQNGFELISDFKVTTGNHMVNSVDENSTYRIYEYKNITTLSGYKVRYIQ